jgi:hypothetical protein
MRSGKPPWIEHRDALDDRERYASMTPEERLAVFVEVCELAEAILADRPDRKEVLAHVDPLPPDAERTWQRLVRESMRERTTR